MLLGPSHHAYIPGLALSPFSEYDTPLGSIPLDTDGEHAPLILLDRGSVRGIVVIMLILEVELDRLEDTKLFQSIRPGVDEDEHSLEMHLPYIRHVFAGCVLHLTSSRSTHYPSEGALSVCSRPCQQT